MATLAAITAAAAHVVAVSGSPATVHPSATATSGFTNAWVPTREGDATRSSHEYAENANVLKVTSRRW